MINSSIIGLTAPNAGITKTGSKTLTLTSSGNSYTGATTVSNGTLSVSTAALIATIGTNSLDVQFTPTPADGTYSILSGTLASALGTPVVTGLAINQVWSVTNSPNLAVIVSTSVANPYDTWAASYGLLPNVTVGTNAGAPVADPDSDGFNNGSEYAFGTIPNVPTGSLLSTVAASGAFTVSWKGPAAGVTYFVQSTTNLATATFTNSGTPISTNVPGIMSFTVPISGNNFYRVRAEPTGN